jgi:hypothetical protein
VPRLKELLNAACDDAIDGLPDRKRRQLNNRITREAAACSAGLDQQDAVKISMSLYYFTKSLTDCGVLELWEGSAMGEAMELLFPAYSRGFSEPRLDASAQKAARQMLHKLQRAGFYHGAEAALAA